MIGKRELIRTSRVALVVPLFAGIMGVPVLAGYTQVVTNAAGHKPVLEAIYGNTFSCTAWDASGQCIQFKNNVSVQATRVQDFGYPSWWYLELCVPYDMGGDDDVWTVCTDDTMTADAMARSTSAMDEEFGFNSDGTFNSLFFTVSGSGFTGLTFVRNVVLTWCMNSYQSSGTYYYSSDPFLNGGDDHMITYRVTCPGLNENVWLVFWEDMPGLGDHDYNDLVVQIRCEREPTPPVPTVSAWGVGILALLLLTGGKIYFVRRRGEKVSG